MEKPYFVIEKILLSIISKNIEYNYILNDYSIIMHSVLSLKEPIIWPKKKRKRNQLRALIDLVAFPY